LHPEHREGSASSSMPHHPLFHRMPAPCVNCGHTFLPAKPDPSKPAPIQPKSLLSTRPPHKSTTQSHFSVGTVNPPVPNSPQLPTFPLALNSTAFFSKTHPIPNSSRTKKISHISTFPAATVTTAGLYISLFNSFPIPVALHPFPRNNQILGTPPLAQPHRAKGGSQHSSQGKPIPTHNTLDFIEFTLVFHLTQLRPLHTIKTDQNMG